MLRRLKSLPSYVARAWRQSPAATTLIAAAWTLAALVAGAALGEAGLRIRHAWLDARDQTRWTERVRAYEPFVSEELHPYYLFGLPSGANARAAANAFCSLDALGFREPGPGRADGRKLAFVLGGSVVFGIYASSNDATITSHLNRLQSQFFFVNAGVPGFTSTQELQRYVMELRDYAPALVVALNGVNDALLAGDYSRYAGHVPIGAPEMFPELHDLVVRASTNPWRLLTIDTVFPELTTWMARAFSDHEPVPETPRQRILEGAAQYLKNRATLASLIAHDGARLVSIFQPVASLHRHVDRQLAPHDTGVAAFYEAVTRGDNGRAEVHDLARVFDEEFPAVPVRSGDLTDDLIFVDGWHLTDRANAIVARRLWSAIETGR